jgi:hypothetical protein
MATEVARRAQGFDDLDFSGGLEAGEHQHGIDAGARGTIARRAATPHPGACQVSPPQRGGIGFAVRLLQHPCPC